MPQVTTSDAIFSKAIPVDRNLTDVSMSTGVRRLTSRSLRSSAIVTDFQIAELQRQQILAVRSSSSGSTNGTTATGTVGSVLDDEVNKDGKKDDLGYLRTVSSTNDGTEPKSNTMAEINGPQVDDEEVELNRLYFL